MITYDSNTSSAQNHSLSESGPSLLTGYRTENGLTAVWSELGESSNLSGGNGVDDNSYRYSEGQVLASSSDLGSWFGADHVDSQLSRRRRKLYKRLWRIDQGLDIDPSDRSLGIEAAHYADPDVDFECITSDDIFIYRFADACVQQMELPRSVRKEVLNRASGRDHRRFNRLGGLEGAIIGYSMMALAKGRQHSSIMQLKCSEWWSMIHQLAETTGVTGTTGRTFRQLTEYVDDQYKGNE